MEEEEEEEKEEEGRAETSETSLALAEIVRRNSSQSRVRNLPRQQSLTGPRTGSSLVSHKLETRLVHSHWSRTVETGVASPPVLCHKEPARASKAPYHFVFVFCLLPAGSLWHKGSYNRTYERLWMRRAGSLWHKITTEDLDSNVGPRPMRVDQSGRDAEVLSSISTRSIYQAGAIHQLQ